MRRPIGCMRKVLARLFLTLFCALSRGRKACMKDAWQMYGFFVAPEPYILLTKIMIAKNSYVPEKSIRFPSVYHTSCHAQIHTPRHVHVSCHVGHAQIHTPCHAFGKDNNPKLYTQFKVLVNIWLSRLLLHTASFVCICSVP